MSRKGVIFFFLMLLCAVESGKKLQAKRFLKIYFPIYFSLAGRGAFSTLNVVCVNVLEYWEDGNAMFRLQLLFQGCLCIQELDTGFSK